MTHRLLLALIAGILFANSLLAQDGKTCATAITVYSLGASTAADWTKYTAQTDGVIVWRSTFSGMRTAYEGSCTGIIVGRFADNNYGCFRCKKGVTYYFNTPSGYSGTIQEKAEAPGDVQANPLELKNTLQYTGDYTTWLHYKPQGDSVAKIFLSRYTLLNEVYENGNLILSTWHSSALTVRFKTGNDYIIKVYNREGNSVRMVLSKEAAGDFEDNPLYITKEKGFAVKQNEQINVWLAYRPAQTGKCSFYVKNSSFMMNSEDAVEVKSTLDTCKANAPELIQVCGYAKADDTIKVTEYSDENGVTPQCINLMYYKGPRIKAVLGKNMIKANDGISTHLTQFATSYALGYSALYFIAPREIDLIITDSTNQHFVDVLAKCKNNTNCSGGWVDNNAGEASLHCMAGDSVLITWEKHLGDGAESFPFYLIDASTMAGAAKNRPITMIPGKTYSVMNGQEVFFRYVVKNRYTRVSLTGAPRTLDLLYALNRTSNVFKPGDTIAFHNSLYWGSHPVDPKPVAEQTFRIDTCAIMPGDVDSIPYILKEGNNIIDQPACFSTTRYYSYKSKRTGYLLIGYGYSTSIQSVIKPCKADSTMRFTSSVVGFLVIHEMPIAKGLQPNNPLFIDTGIVTQQFKIFDQLTGKPFQYYAYVAPRDIHVSALADEAAAYLSTAKIKPSGTVSDRNDIALKKGDTLLITLRAFGAQDKLWTLREVLPSQTASTKGSSCQTAIELSGEGIHEHSFFGKDIDPKLIDQSNSALWYKTVVSNPGLFYVEAGTTIVNHLFYKNNCQTQYITSTTNERTQSSCILAAGDTVVFSITNKERIFFYTKQGADSMQIGIRRTDTLLLHQGMNILPANALCVKYIPTKDCNVRLIPSGLNQSVSSKYTGAVKKGQVISLSLIKNNWDTLSFRIYVSEFNEQKYNTMQTALSATLGINQSTTDTAQFDQWYRFVAPKRAYYSVATANQYQLYFAVKPFNTLSYTKVNLLEKGDTLLIKTNPTHTNAVFTFNITQIAEPEKAVNTSNASCTITHDTTLYVALKQLYLYFADKPNKIIDITYPSAIARRDFLDDNLYYSFKDGISKLSLFASSSSTVLLLSDTCISKISISWRNPLPGELPATAFDAQIGRNNALPTAYGHTARYFKYTPKTDGFISIFTPNNRMDVSFFVNYQFIKQSAVGTSFGSNMNSSLACFKDVPLYFKIAGDSISSWFLYEYQSASLMPYLQSAKCLPNQDRYANNTNSYQFDVDHAFFFTKRTSTVTNYQQAAVTSFWGSQSPIIPNASETIGIVQYEYQSNLMPFTWQLVKKPLRTTSALAYFEPVIDLKGKAPLLARFVAPNESRNAFSFKFDFEGDGVIDSSASYLTISKYITHIYTKPGIYSPTIIVSNGVESDTLVLTNNVEVLAADGTCEKPRIIAHSLAGDNSYCLGAAFNISAIVRNDEPFSVKKDGKLIAQNVQQYTVARFDSTQVGYYQIVTKNQCGADSSAVVYVQSKIKPSIAMPDTVAVCNASPVLLKHKDASMALWNKDGYENKTISITQSAYYTAFSRNDNGCYSYDSVRIEKNGTPHFSLGKDSTIAAGQSITLHCPAGGSLVWNDGSRASVRNIAHQANATKQTLSASFTSDYGCTASDTITIYSKAVTDTTTHNLSSGNNPNLSIKLYPVPTHTQLTIDAGLQTITQITIFDAQGKMVIKHTANASIAQITTAHLTQGIYIVQIETTQAVFTHTINKEE